MTKGNSLRRLDINTFLDTFPDLYCVGVDASIYGTCLGRRVLLDSLESMPDRLVIRLITVELGNFWAYYHQENHTKGQKINLTC
jgi:hypothetical protein